MSKEQKIAIVVITGIITCYIMWLYCLPAHGVPKRLSQESGWIYPCGEISEFLRKIYR